MANGVNTEWFDLQVKHGNYLPKEKEQTLAEIQAEMKAKKEQQNKIQNVIGNKQTKDQLDQLEDEFDDEITRKLMAQRYQEIKQKAANYKYGKVLQISRDQYVREVTQADPQSFVVLHLYDNSNQFCNLINKHLPTLADAHPLVKFIKIVATKCIDNFPDRNCPCIIIYKAGKPVSNIINVDKYLKGDVENLEDFLQSHNVFSNDMK